MLNVADALPLYLRLHLEICAQDIPTASQESARNQVLTKTKTWQERFEESKNS